MSEQLQNSLLMRSLRRERVERRPVWLMRQAGRYLPEYRSLRKEAGGFLKMVKTPELACQITLQPIDRFGFDAAIIFSDILIIPDALDLGLKFIENVGPRITNPLTDEKAVSRLKEIESDSFRYLFEACQLTRRSLPKTTPLIGFCGAPFTLACYMIDGQGGDFFRTRAMLRSRPKLFHEILFKTTEVVKTALIGQIKSGCQVVMLFDSWGGLLADDLYEEFSLSYIRNIIEAIKQETTAPVIVFGRQCASSLSAIAMSGCDAVGVDWQTSMTLATQRVGHDVALQGNMDPAVLLTDPETVARETQKILDKVDKERAHIFNLGHGVNKETPLENVEALLEAVRRKSL